MKKEETTLGRIEALNIAVIMPRFFIKSKTNDKEYAKQYFLAIQSDTTDAALIIRKLVLSDNFRLYEDYKLLKEYKGMGLFETRFSIKLSTLNMVISALNGA